MIEFNAVIRNPFSHRFSTFFYRGGEFPMKNKCWEVQGMLTNDILNINFSLTTRTDHAGLRVQLGLLGVNFCLDVYDSRHWNDDADGWQTYQ